MSKYTLTYFHIRGRAEVSRLIFAAAGQQYEDRRLQEFVEPDYAKVALMKGEDRKYTEEWLKLKPSSPTGYAPFLEVDGVKIAQSRVIVSFLGKRLGLAGKTDLDEAKAAMIAETAEEFFIFPIYYHLFEESDQEKRLGAVKKYATETIPNIMATLEKLVGEKGYFIGDQLSYADIAFYYSSTHTAYIEPLSEQMLGQKFQVEIDWAKYPKLKAVVDHVTSNPGIAKWLKERPQTQF